MTSKEAIKYLITPIATSTEPSAEYLKQKEAYELAIKVLEEIDNAPTVELKRVKNELNNELNELRPQGEWIRKEDVIHSIAKQYSEHNELVPIWLSIGDMRGGAE